MNDDTDGDTMTVETRQGESSFTATGKWSKSLRPEVEPFFAFECKWSIVFFAIWLWEIGLARRRSE